jgi:hypothetical protein
MDFTALVFQYADPALAVGLLELNQQHVFLR